MTRVRALTLLIVLVCIPALASAQRMAAGPKHEFGVDLSAVYSMPSCSGCSGHIISAMTPVDVRVGFLSSGKLSFEARFSGTWINTDVGGSSTTLVTLGPGANLLYRLAGTAPNHNTYLTVGGELAYAKATGSSSTTQFSVDGGIGLRRGKGALASRAELFGAYSFKTSSTLAMIHIGLRLGMSFFD